MLNLLNKIKDKEINILYVYDLSRLERSPEAKAIIFGTLKKAGAQLYTEIDGYIDFENDEIKEPKDPEPEIKFKSFDE